MELLVLPWMMHASTKPPLGDLSSMYGRSCFMKAGPHDVMASSSFCLQSLGLYGGEYGWSFMHLMNNCETKHKTAQ